MRVFVTGASGFIGEVTTKELIAHGHTVLGLARSAASEQKLKALGADSVRGELTDLAELRQAAAASDGVIHLGFVHDFAQWAQALETDRNAIRAMTEAMAGGGKPFVGTTGTLGLVASDGKAADEDDTAPESPRGAAEEMVRMAKGVRGAVVRLSPTSHGAGDQGFTPTLVAKARENGAALYAGDGANAWQAVHRDDAAVLYRLVLEKGEAGRAYHAVAEPALTMRAISEEIARGLVVEAKSVSADEAAAKFGMFARFAAMGIPVSSAKTQSELGWTPKGLTLFEDIREHYLRDAVVAKYA